MPRKPRIFSSTGIYHIILRSVNQRIIFEEDSDYQKFLFTLTDCKKNMRSIFMHIVLWIIMSIYYYLHPLIVCQVSSGVSVPGLPAGTIANISAPVIFFKRGITVHLLKMKNISCLCLPIFTTTP